MAVTALVFCAVVFFIGYFCEPKKINPITIFFGEWTIILFLAKLNLFSLEKASDRPFSYILWGCIFFAAGFYWRLVLYNKIHFKLKKKVKRNETYCYRLNYKILYFLLVFTLLFFILDSINAVKILLHGGTLSYIRQQAQDGVQYSYNVYMNAVRILIASPVSFATMPLAAIELFKKKKNKLVMCLVIAISVLRVIADGGRSPFIFLGLSLVVCYFYQNEGNALIRKRMDRIRIKKFRWTKKTRYFLSAAIIGIFFLWRVTLSRSGSDTLKYTYYYFAMEPLMLEKWAVKTDEANLYGFGMASFNGFLFPLFYIIANGFKVNYPIYWRQVYDLIESTGSNWQIITTKGLTANSYVTAFWNLYLDARWVGIIIGMFIFGIFVASAYEKVLYEQNEKNLSVFCLVMLGEFYSFQFMIFENMYYAIGFILLQFILYKRVRRGPGGDT